MSPGTVCPRCVSLGVARTPSYQKPSRPAVPFTPGIPALLPLVFLVFFLLGLCWASAELGWWLSPAFKPSLG